MYTPIDAPNLQIFHLSPLPRSRSHSGFVQLRDGHSSYDSKKVLKWTNNWGQGSNISFWESRKCFTIS